ncbi:imidazole glycerol phosphate synthase subunit HisH [bacterium]|nr:imidazole glycerol phosphate synthase subunit HisH [bacterium]
MIVITDYGAGNLKSIANILDMLNAEYKISSEQEDILSASAIIFPGQGHFGQAVNKLNEIGLKNTIIEAVNIKKIKFLGICLGLQILFEKSEEAPEVKGLSILKGEVKKFTCNKIPQIGWNNITVTGNNTYLSNDYYYFVNSFYVIPDDNTIISSKCNYSGIDFCSSIQKNNITAVQFHPEKSSEAGIKFFQKWLES